MNPELHHSRLRDDLGRSSPWVMGILNLTPDSFSDGGTVPHLELALERSKEFLSCGASIIDIGGEATGPGSSPVSAEEECQRILPAVEAISKFAFVSVDTFKSSTALQALQRGARMINDISGLRADKEMVAVIRDWDCYIVIMHSKEAADHPHVSLSTAAYSDVVQEITTFLLRQVDWALSRGLSPSQIILDPGMGKFLSQDPNVSWELLRRFDELTNELHPFPVLIGTSRKGFLGGELQGRDVISQLTALSCVEKGAAIIRTHNVSMASEFLSTWQRLERFNLGCDKN